jgi:hypothetical protein
VKASANPEAVAAIEKTMNAGMSGDIETYTKGFRPGYPEQLRCHWMGFGRDMLSNRDML